MAIFSFWSRKMRNVLKRFPFIFSSNKKEILSLWNLLDFLTNNNCFFEFDAKNIFPYISEGSEKKKKIGKKNCHFFPYFFHAEQKI